MDWVEMISKDEKTIKLRLKDPGMLDTGVFSKMESDENTLPCLLSDPAAGVLVYRVENMLTLKDFLDQYVFEKEEGYLFLNKLFEMLVSSNRNKPVLFEPEYVFVSGFGNEFRFVIVPVSVEYWMFQKEKLKEWIGFITTHLKTTTAYELIGYLVRFSSADEFSLPALIQGLDMLQRKTYPRKWYQHKPKEFKAKEEIKVYSSPSIPDSFLLACDLPQKSEEFSGMTGKEKMLDMEERTQLIGEGQSGSAWLEDERDTYQLLLEEMVVGRGMQCDIRLSDPSVSLQHAKITCQDEKYYIQDLKSSNHTFLNEKQVVRKMRLKDGMKIRFGMQELIFRQ